MCSGVVDAPARGQPAAGRERGAAHEPRGPDVAVDAALVAEAVVEARLAEQLVELRLVLRGHLGADFGDAGLDVEASPARRPTAAMRIARSSASGSSSAEGSEMSKPSSSRLPTRSR